MSAITFSLKGLDCAHCASKIEAGIGRLDIAKSATVDFLNKKAEVGIADNVAYEDAAGIIIKEIKKIDPAVVVSVINSENEANDIAQSHGIDSRLKIKKIIQYGVGLSFIIASFFMQQESLKIAMYIGAYLVFGGQVLVKLIGNLKRGQIFDENFLMGAATLGAIAIGEYPEAVGVMLFYNIGEFFQDMAVDKSRRSIKALVGIKPDIAHVVSADGTVSVHPGTVEVGSLIIVKPGERIPLDGIIEEGTSQIDTSALTGESVPRLVKEGEEVLSGTINVTGLIKIRTAKNYSSSAVVKILELVEKVSAKKAPTEQFITRFSRYYTPAVVLAAVCISVIPPILLSQPFADWFYRGLVFLVVSCPCALVLSVPLGYFSGLGACSKSGILVKGGNYLEALTRMDNLVFDKTGTLTKGVFNVTEIVREKGFENIDILEAAANIENFSNHPIAKSIAAKYDGVLDENAVSAFEDIAGHGVKAEFRGDTYYLGNAALMSREGIKAAPYNGLGSVVYIGINGRFAGHIVVSDEIKEDSKEAVCRLKAMGIKLAMLTGDKKETANAVGAALGIDRIHSELMPDEKLNMLERIMSESKNRKTAFAGDGINDAPALARADISIAMGGLGQDAAIEAADIVIMNDSPQKIADAVYIARRTQKIVWQNIVFALSVKAIILLLGAIGIANMWMAMFADVGVALLAVINSMRAMRQ